MISASLAALLSACDHMARAAQHWRDARAFRKDRRGRGDAIFSAISAERDACRELRAAGLPPAILIDEAYLRLRDGYGGATSYPLVLDRVRR